MCVCVCVCVSQWKTGKVMCTWRCERLKPFLGRTNPMSVTHAVNSDRPNVHVPLGWFIGWMMVQARSRPVYRCAMLAPKE